MLQSRDENLLEWTMQKIQREDRANTYNTRRNISHLKLYAQARPQAQKLGVQQTMRPIL